MIIFQQQREKWIEEISIFEQKDPSSNIEEENFEFKNLDNLKELQQLDSNHILEIVKDMEEAILSHGYVDNFLNEDSCAFDDLQETSRGIPRREELLHSFQYMKLDELGTVNRSKRRGANSNHLLLRRLVHLFFL